MNGWPIVYFESHDAAIAAGAEFTPGTCYPETLSTDYPRTFRLSMRYTREHSSSRPPLAVVCPGGNVWPIDCLAGGEAPHGEGWSITGDAKAGTLTASPSINFPGRYHGWLQYGRLTEDCEGRKFDRDGKPAAG